MTLSKREKRMLYVLGCFLLLAIGIYLFILPAINTNTALAKQLEELETQRLVRVQSIARMGALDTRVKLLRKEITSRSARYSPPMLSEALDRQFTSMLRRYNALPEEFTIGEISEDTAITHFGEKTATGNAELAIADVPPLDDYMAAVKPNASKNATTPTEPTSQPSTADVADPTTRTQVLSIKAIMKQADAMAFLAELSADPAIVISSAEISDIMTLAVGTEAVVVSDNVSLSVEFSTLLASDLPDSTSQAPTTAFS